MPLAQTFSRSSATAVFVALFTGLLFGGAIAVGQQQTSHWYFGVNAALRFPQNGSPVALSGSAMYSYEGCASVSSPITGQLLFYTNGVTVWDRRNQIMAGGDMLGGSDHAAQSSLILQHPADDSSYVVFVADFAHGLGPFGPRGNGIRALTIDMRSNGGYGAVIGRTPQLHAFTTEHLCAVPKRGQKGFWIISHESASPNFVVWSLGVEGITGPTIQPLLWRFPLVVGTGWMKASPDGTHLAVANECLGKMAIELFRFDPRTGVVSDTSPNALPLDADPYGASFSPNGSRLFVSTGTGGCTPRRQLVQFDLLAGDSAAVARSRYVLDSTNRIGALQLGPNGVLYASPTGANYLSAIIDPDSVGGACSFLPLAVSLGGAACRWGLPNMIDGALGLRRIANTDTLLCAGSRVQLLARWIANPRWLPQAGLSCSDCFDPIATPDSSTTYYLFDQSDLTNALDSVTIAIDRISRATVTGDTIICRGDESTVTLQTRALIRWVDSDSTGCADCATIKVRPSTTTTYRYALTSVSGCIRLDSVVISVVDPPVVVASPDTAICYGASVMLSVRGGDSVEWAPSPSLSCTACSNPTASPRATTVYIVKSWNSATCVAWDTIVVVVGQPLPIDAGPDTNVCAGTPVGLHASGAARLVWDASQNLSCIDCSDPTASIDSTTTFYVTGFDATGCSFRDSVTVTVHNYPRLVLSGDSVVCAGASARILARGAVTYRWWSSSSTTSCVTCDEQFVAPLTSTTYFVEGRNESGCASIDSFVVAVVDKPSVVSSGNAVVCSGDSVGLSASGADEYQWTPSDGLSCIICRNPIAAPRSTTLYRVVGSVASGCADTAEVLVTVRDRRIITAVLLRGVHLAPGATGTLEGRFGDELVTDSLRLDISWRSEVANVERVLPARDLVEQSWRAVELQRSPNALAVLLTGPRAVRVGPGTVFTIDVAAFLGDSLSTEIPFTIRTTASSCGEIKAESGSIRLDSLCGLSWRLIETSTTLLRLDPPSPNPSHAEINLTYSLPNSGPVRLELIANTGLNACLPIDAVMNGGEHTGRFDVSHLATGVYTIRLRFGDEVRSRRVIVLR